MPPASDGPPLCPSVKGTAPDAVIIGAIRADGAVASIPTPIPLTHAMRATVARPPETIFRLAGACTAADCAQWAEGRCGLVSRLRAQLAPAAELPNCGIRRACVWWRQDGPAACRICPSVTYNPSA